MDLKSGDVIRGPFWREPVEIKLIEQSGKYIQIVGSTTISRTHIDQMIPLAEFNKITSTGTSPCFVEQPWKIFLSLEAKRYQLPRFMTLF